MKIDIGSDLKIEHDFTEVSLPNQNNPYLELYSFANDNGGDFQSAFFRFDSDRIFLKLEIDGIEIFDISIDKLDAFLGYNENNLPIKCPVNYSKDKKMVSINFGNPIKFKESISISARADSNSSSRDSLGYLVVLSGIEV